MKKKKDKDQSYMHYELNPPVAHSNLISHQIFLTDDYAAKVYISLSFDWLCDRCLINNRL